ncbi:MAG: ribonuclease P protein component [Solirubrobacteraceae bacterium]
MVQDPSAPRPRRTKRRRLSRSAEFERVYRRGRSRGNRWLVLHAFPRAEGNGARLGLSVGRKVGGAVERAGVKRVLREAFWSRVDALDDEQDYVIVARASAQGLVKSEGLAGAQRALDDLLATAAEGSTAADDGHADPAKANPEEADPFP